MGSVITWALGSPPLLGFSSATLGIQPAFLGPRCWLGCTARFWTFTRSVDKLDEPLDRVLPVRLLRAETVSMNHQKAVFRDPFTRQAYQADADIQRQRGRTANVEA